MVNHIFPIDPVIPAMFMLHPIMYHPLKQEFLILFDLIFQEKRTVYDRKIQEEKLSEDVIVSCEHIIALIIFDNYTIRFIKRCRTV